MPIDIINHHEQQKESDGQWVNRKKEWHDHNNTGFNNRLERMKGHRCPGRWVGRQMMNAMDPTVDSSFMHEPMCPIKVGIVKDDH